MNFGQESYSEKGSVMSYFHQTTQLLGTGTGVHSRIKVKQCVVDLAPSSHKKLAQSVASCHLIPQRTKRGYIGNNPYYTEHNSSHLYPFGGRYTFFSVALMVLNY